MSAGKDHHLCFPIFYRLPIVLILVISLSIPGRGFAAGSPFEIEIGDLERGEVVSKDRKKPRSRPAKKKRGKRPAVPQPKTEDRQAGDFTRYTVRPGDYIFKILTTRFGLSSAKAEALIPEVKRINGIVDTSGLQIGQTLLLPLSGKKVIAPPETVQAPVPATSPASAPVPVITSPVAASSPAAEVPPTPAPSVDEGLLRRAKDFWARLFPERQPPETATGKEKADLAQDPVLAGINGQEIRIVSPGQQPVFGNYSGVGAENRETIVADPADEKGFVKELLQAAGFATTDGGTPLEFGTAAKLLLKVDFTAAQRVPGVEKRKTILVAMTKNGCQPLPESFVSYLAARDFRLLLWCDRMDSSPVSAPIELLSATPGTPEALVDTVLAALGIQSSKDYPIEIQVGQAGSAPLTVSVDRYFEGNGKRVFIDFGKATPNRATLFRLLELADYQRIAIADREEVRTVAAKISTAANIPAAYRTHRLTSLPDGLFTLDLAGILFRKPGTAGEQVFLADDPVEQPFFDLLKTVPWGTP